MHRPQRAFPVQWWYTSICLSICLESRVFVVWRSFTGSSLLFDVNNYDKAKWSIGPKGVQQGGFWLDQLRQPQIMSLATINAVSRDGHPSRRLHRGQVRLRGPGNAAPRYPRASSSRCGCARPACPTPRRSCRRRTRATYRYTSSAAARCSLKKPRG